MGHAVNDGEGFEPEHLADLLKRCNVELNVVRNQKDVIEGDRVHWSTSDFGVCPKGRRIYEINIWLSRKDTSEFNRLIVLHELAHIVFWSGLGVECPEGLLIVWENRVLQALSGRKAAMMHLVHPYTTSSPIQRQRSRHGAPHQDLSASEFGDLPRQAWWPVAEEELDKMGLKGGIGDLTQPISKRKLRSAMIRVADAQGFELPARYEAGRRGQHG